jgi:hypothetical protein
MADRNLVTYQEDRINGGPYWRLMVDRSASGQPSIQVTLQHEDIDGRIVDEMTVIVKDAWPVLAPVLAWLAYRG